MIGQDIENLLSMSAVRMDCFGSGSKVMAPSGPVLLPPLLRESVGEGASPLFARLLDEDSLGDSSGLSVSELGDGESYPCMGLGGMGEGSPQRCQEWRISKAVQEAEGEIAYSKLEICS